jgi:hypothetical protein
MTYPYEGLEVVGHVCVWVARDAVLGRSRIRGRENKVSSTRVPEFETELGLRRHYMSLSCKCLVPQIDTFIGRARAKPCPLLPQFYIT